MLYRVYNSGHTTATTMLQLLQSEPPLTSRGYSAMAVGMLEGALALLAALVPILWALLRGLRTISNLPDQIANLREDQAREFKDLHSDHYRMAARIDRLESRLIDHISIRCSCDDHH